MLVGQCSDLERAAPISLRLDPCQNKSEPFVVHGFRRARREFINTAR